MSIKLNNLFAKNAFSINKTNNSPFFNQKINFKGNLKKDSFQLQTPASAQESIQKLETEIETLIKDAPYEKQKLEEKLAKAQQDCENLEKEDGGNKSQVKYAKCTITKIKNQIQNFDENLDEKIAAKKDTIKKLEKFIQYQKTNPEIAFLFDVNLARQDKLKQIKSSPYIVALHGSALKYDVPLSLLRIFTDSKDIEKDVTKGETCPYECCDTIEYACFKSDEEKEMYEDFVKNFGKKTSYDDLVNSIANNKTMDSKKISNFIKSGQLVPFGFEDYILSDSDIDKNVREFAFDTKNPINKKFIKDYKNYLKILEQNYSKPFCEAPTASLKTASIASLRKYGFGTAAHIYCTFKDNFSQSRLQKGNKIDLTNPVVQNVLKLARESNPLIMSIEELENLLGYEVLSKATSENKIEFISNNVLKKDGNKLFIDITSPKNREFFKSIDDDDLNLLIQEKIQQARLLSDSEISLIENNLKKQNDLKRKIEKHNEETRAYFELVSAFSQKERFEIEYQLSKALVEEEEQAFIKKQETTKKEAYNSLFTAIRWSLCPKTREVMANIAKENKEIQRILKKLSRLEALEAKQEESKTPEYYEDEIRKNTLTSKEEITLKAYYKKVWKIAGTEEFASTKQKAAEIAQNFLENGIDSLDDNFTKQRIKRWLKNKPKEAKILLKP